MYPWTEQNGKVPEPLFTIDVVLHENHMVVSSRGTVNMVCFGGRCDCDFFHGEVLSGGVDTQMYLKDEPHSLSARYMLRGTDAKGCTTRIFVENVGEMGPDDQWITRPRFLTDNPDLAWLEETPLLGRVLGSPEGVTIAFYKEIKQC